MGGFADLALCVVPTYLFLQNQQQQQQEEGDAQAGSNGPGARDSSSRSSSSSSNTSTSSSSSSSEPVPLAKVDEVLGVLSIRDDLSGSQVSELSQQAQQHAASRGDACFAMRLHEMRSSRKCSRGGACCCAMRLHDGGLELGAGALAGSSQAPTRAHGAALIRLHGAPFNLHHPMRIASQVYEALEKLGPEALRAQNTLRWGA